MCQLAKNEMAHNRYYSFNDIEEKIDSVTLSSFNRVCTNIFMDKRFTIVSIGKLDSVDENELYLNV